MRKAEEESMQVFLCPPLSSSSNHLCTPGPSSIRGAVASTSRGQGPEWRPFPGSTPPRYSIIRSDALVDPPARRTRPKFDISGHPHHWFRMRAEWQEERFCAMIKLLLFLLPHGPSVCILLCMQEPVVSRDDIVHPRVNQPQRESLAPTNHPASDLSSYAIPAFRPTQTGREMRSSKS